MRTHVIAIEDNEPIGVYETGVSWENQNQNKIPIDRNETFLQIANDATHRKYIMYIYSNTNKRAKYTYTIFSNETEEYTEIIEEKIEGVWTSAKRLHRPKFTMCKYSDIYGDKVTKSDEPKPVIYFKRP